MTGRLTIIRGDALEKLRELESESVQCCVTSPPYWGLRDYEKHDRQIGLEKTPEEYIDNIVAVSREIRRVLRKDGTFWLNLGDSYSSGGRESYDPSKVSKTSGLTNNSAGNTRSTPIWAKPKDRLMIPARVAIALQSDGWYLRDEIVWYKPNPMPESVTDRTTKSHEMIYLLTRSSKYYYDYQAILEPAAYDGRIDTMMKGSKKYEISVIPGQAEHTMSAHGSERWPNKLAYRQKDDDYGPNSQPFNSIHAIEGEPARNKRSVWRVTTQNFGGAHFATYPPDLIKPCIMAGTSAKGCCAKCGAPWERVLDGREALKVEASEIDRFGTGEAGTHRKIGGQYQKWIDDHPLKTLGWQPTCDCSKFPGAERYPFNVNPCTVLDPFAGSGTTGMVAIELGRKAILIDLSYQDLQRERCDITPGLPLA